MPYRKREIIRDIETDLEFRRISQDESGVIEVIKKIISGGSGSTGGAGSPGGAGTLLKKASIWAYEGQVNIIIEPYVEDSVSLYLNGQLLPNGFSYFEENPSSGLIRFSEPLVQNDWVYITYIRR